MSGKLSKSGVKWYFVANNLAQTKWAKHLTFKEVTVFGL